MPTQSPTSQTPDIEKSAGHSSYSTTQSTHLHNTVVETFAWRNITVTVQDTASKAPKPILSNVSGCIRGGEICALMGPSGCGKTTLLNVLAHRNAAAGAKVSGETFVNGIVPSLSTFRDLSSYVEQEDALIGSLTVRETMDFAARLSLPSSVSKIERLHRIDDLLMSFGLRDQSHTIIGTPIRKGISGGQKRRVSVASQLITEPKIMFLDEPTSGLDSAASFEVMSFIKEVARANNLIIIASIHQPSTSTFQLFDKLVLLSSGKNHYVGPVANTKTYFDSIGFQMPVQTNPAEYILDIMNVDFSADRETATKRLDQSFASWEASGELKTLHDDIDGIVGKAPSSGLPSLKKETNKFLVPVILIHRLFIKSYRDVVAYGIRIAMYIGLAIMMGTVWLRLDTNQNSIQSFINAIFFGSAFMSFMAVAYVPSFLEDRATYIKERANGLYGPTAFTIANFFIGLPYLFFISLLFSVIAYWLSNFRPTADAFFMWIMWLFLDLVAAESLVVLMTSLFPNFVIALALTAFANGLWMSVGGFLVSPKILNVFWRYVFHYIDYQTYVFQGMMVNEFADRSYSCGESCVCMYQTDLADQCRIAGVGVLKEYGYHTGHTGEWVGILLGIVLGYRLLGWAALKWRP